MRLKVEPHEEAKRRYGISGASRQRYSPEEKVRIVVAGLRGEDSVAELCRKEGINQNQYYRSSRTSWRRARSG
jgi:transposase